MKFFERTTAGSGSAAPWLVTWRDATGRVALDLPLRVLRDIDTACNGTSHGGAGVLVGSIHDRVRVHYAFPLERNAEGDLSPAARERLLSCSPAAEKTACTVGLFAADGEDQPAAIHRLAVGSKAMLPDSMPVLLVGKQGATVFLWQAATSDLVPLSPELSFHQSPVSEQPQPDAEYTLFSGAPEARPQPRLAGKPQSGYAVPEHAFAHPKTTIHLEIPRWIWGPALLIVVVLAFAVGRYLRLTPPADPAASSEAPVAATVPPRSQLGFQVSRHGTDLLLSWDRDLARTLAARSGLLEIRDGGVARAIPVTDADLLSGQILYVPGSKDIEITLVAFTGSGIIRENVKVLQAEKIGAGSGPFPRNQTPLPRIPDPATETRTRVLSLPAGGEPRLSPPAHPDAFTTSKPEPQATTAVAPILVPVTIPAPLTQTAGPVVLPEPKPLPPAVTSIAVQPREPSEAARKPISATPPAQVLPIADEQSASPVAQNSAVASGQGVAAAVPTRQVPPIVPASFRSLMMRETIVKVKLAVDAEGKVLKAEAAPETLAPLRYIAEEAGRRWRFRPATRDGKPIPSEYFINFRFKR